MPVFIGMLQLGRCMKKAINQGAVHKLFQACYIYIYIYIYDF